jgi:DHA1 family inner membrane transport protein
MVGARYPKRSGGFWFAATALSALLMGVASNIWLSAAGMVLWGLFFWFAVPAVLRSIEAYSDRPGERSGDAQAAMAVGRVIGPLLGGILLAWGDLSLLGVVSFAGMAGGAAVLLGVERYRRHAVARG